MSDSPVTRNAWQALKAFTDARIALGRAGVSLPTQEVLAFQQQHAQARDAVHTPLDGEALLASVRSELQQRTLPPCVIEALLPAECQSILHSRAADRREYLQRPDLGRRLEAVSVDNLQAWPRPSAGYDLALVCVDGLSAVAVERHAPAFLAEFVGDMLAAVPDLSLAPLTVCLQGRVAVGDEIALALAARTVVVLIGERPGLSSPDSLGLYLTHAPRLDSHDAQRNCISNIRTAGLSYPQAAKKALYLLQEARRLQLSGVGLKDRTEHPAGTLCSSDNFLTRD